MNHIDIFCDGSCIDNGKFTAKAGWSFIVSDPISKKALVKAYGKSKSGIQDSNRAELEAMLQSLFYIYKEGDKNTFYTIHSDSQVTVEGITGEAYRNGSRDIWTQIEKLCSELIGRFTVKFFKQDKKNNVLYENVMHNTANKLAKRGANSLLVMPTQYNEIRKEMILYEQ